MLESRIDEFRHGGRTSSLSNLKRKGKAIVTVRVQGHHTYTHTHTHERFASTYVTVYGKIRCNGAHANIKKCIREACG